GDTEPDAEFGGAVEMSFEMERQVAAEQHEDQQNDTEVVPFPARYDLAGGGGSNEQEEAGVDQHRREPAGVSGKGHAGPAKRPQRDEEHQRSAAQRKPPGPVRDRGKQETGDHGRKEAVEHLVNVPIAWHERGD